MQYLDWLDAGHVFVAISGEERIVYDQDFGAAEKEYTKRLRKGVSDEGI
jgi:hypothetical protein